MRTARQQADELDQAGTFLNAILTHGVEPAKADSVTKEAAPQRHSNGRSKVPKPEHAARFADPPAPPPQQPLPEKPDTSKASPITTSFTSLLKRSDTAKASSHSSHSPTNPQNSQMLSLIEALSIAKKELDSQGARVKHLEDMLKQERSAREDAEERARKLEAHATSRPVSVVEEQAESLADADLSEPKPVEEPLNTDVEAETDERTKSLQQNLDKVLGEMQKLKSDMDQYQQRAETAEADANSARKSLAEMIEKFREENEKAEQSPKKSPERRSPKEAAEASDMAAECEDDPGTRSMAKWTAHANGHVRAPRLPEHLERAVATVLQERNGQGDSLAQSAPYVSMLGVVLIGVGLMAYLNSWQKSER